MKEDVLSKEFYSVEERYADLINGIGFQGRQVVKKEDLTELDTQTGIWKMPLARGKRKRGIKNRDLIRKTAFGINFAVIGIENQELIDYALPLRNMSYDAGEYERQASKIRNEIRKGDKKLTKGEYLYGFGRESKLHPVVTFILYYGKEEWDGATDLHSIIDFKGIPQEMKELVQNFKTHIIEVRKLKDTSVFKTDIRQVFDVIRYSEEPDKLKELVTGNSAYQNMEEDTYDMIAAYTHVEELESMKDFHKKKGGKVDMCGAIAGLIEEGKLEGKLEGIKALIEMCEEFNISKEETLGRIKNKFSLSEEEAENYMEDYWIDKL